MYYLICDTYSCEGRTYRARKDTEEAPATKYKRTTRIWDMGPWSADGVLERMLMSMDPFTVPPLELAGFHTKVVQGSHSTARHLGAIQASGHYSKKSTTAWRATDGAAITITMSPP